MAYLALDLQMSLMTYQNMLDDSQSEAGSPTLA